MFGAVRGLLATVWGLFEGFLVVNNPRQPSNTPNTPLAPRAALVTMAPVLAAWLRWPYAVLGVVRGLLWVVGGCLGLLGGV